MNHLEQNKLIALFLGAEYKQDDYEQWGYWFEKPFVENWHTGFNADALKFHTSWDWLMPVVEKVESIEQMGLQAYITIGAFSIDAYSAGSDKKELSEFSFQLTGRQFSGKDKLEATYQAVTAFIEWYNQQPCAT